MSILETKWDRRYTICAVLFEAGLPCLLQGPPHCACRVILHPEDEVAASATTLCSGKGKCK